MLKYLFATIILLAPSTSFADDAGNWDGFQLGLKGGFGIISGKDDLGNNKPLESGVAGVFGGYSHSFHRIVIGLEADVNASNYTAVSSTGDSRSTSKWSTTSTVRLGYDTGKFLPYLSAGVGLAGYEVKRFDDGQKASNTHVGFVVGAGIETKITDNISARIDYKHMKISKEKYQFDGYAPFHIKGQNDLVTLGLAYNF